MCRNFDINAENILKLNYEHLALKILSGVPHLDPHESGQEAGDEEKKGDGKRRTKSERGTG